MKRSLTLFVAAGCGVLGWSQTATMSAPSPSRPSITANEAESPEAIAAKEPNKVVATVNGKPVTAREAWDMLKKIPAEQRKSMPTERLFDQLYALHALAGQAEEQHLDQQSDVKSELELGRESVLARAYMNKLTSAHAKDTVDAQTYYDAHKDQYDTAKLSGIAVAFNPPGTPASPNSPNRTEPEAKAKADDIEKKLKSGADFATEARTDSDDQRSAANGGSLGSVTAAQAGLPQDLRDQVFGKLQPGQISEPIRLPNAYYIIKLDSRTTEPFSAVKGQIEQKLRGDQQQAISKAELDKYKVQVQDPAFFSSGANTAANKVPSLGTMSHGTAAESGPPK